MRISVIALIVSTLIAPLTAMETESSLSFAHRAVETYPNGMGSLPVEEVLSALPIIPTAIEKEATEFYTTHKEFIDAAVTFPAYENYKNARAHRTQKATDLGNMSNYNTTLFFPSKKAVVKIASYDSKLRNRLASCGYDPFNPEVLTTEEKLKDAFAWEGPVIQHITIAIAQRLLEQHKTEVVEPLPTWLYHLPGKSTDLDDDNYITIQQAIPTSFQRFDKLSMEEKKSFLQNLDLAELYKTFKYIHCAFPTTDNLWINTSTHKIMLPDTE
jgi:hypothetical protein